MMDKFKDRVSLLRRTWGYFGVQEAYQFAGQSSVHLAVNSRMSSDYCHAEVSSQSVMDKESGLKKAMGAEKLGADGGFLPVGGEKSAIQKGVSAQRVDRQRSAVSLAKQETDDLIIDNKAQESVEKKASFAPTPVARTRAGTFDDPRSGTDRRGVNMPSLIPISGCRRANQRRSWRSTIASSNSWWMLRGVLRKD